MIKSLIFDLYSMFKRNITPFEHLGNVIQYLIKPDNRSHQLASLYSTGLYSPQMSLLPSNPDSTNTIILTDETLPIKGKQSSMIEVKEVLDQMNEPNDVATSGIDWENTKENEAIIEVVKDVKSAISPGEANIKEELKSDIEEVIFIPTPIKTGPDYTTFASGESDLPKKKKKNSKEQKKSKTLLLSVSDLSPFNQWLLTQMALKGSNINKQAKRNKKKSKKHQQIKSIAKQSIELPEEVASEPLATILWKQGHHERAITMFKMLIQQQPEQEDKWNELIKQVTEELSN